MKQRLKNMLSKLADGLIERDEAIRLALLSALAGEHLLLLGQPGTAKSVLARRLHWAFTNGSYFERLLTKFSVPDELFGPLSIKALENDKYFRLTERYLPSASIAFIDEIFKANSAILNALLTLLNEREFDNGDARVKVPLISVIAASNELPEEEGLLALYDRFLCRYRVEPVSEQRFRNLLQLPDTVPLANGVEPLSKAEIEGMQQSAASVELTEPVLALLAELRAYLRQQQVYVSDRRWRKAVKWLKVAAYTDGRSSVSVWDCWLLQHCLWREPEQRDLIAGWYRGYIGIGGGQHLLSLEKLLNTWEQMLRQDNTSQEQRCDDRGRPLYIGRDGELTTEPNTRAALSRDGAPLYLAPPGNDERSAGRGYSRKQLEQQFFDGLYRQTHLHGQWVHVDNYVSDPANCCYEDVVNKPCMEITRHSPTFVEARLNEIGAVAADLAGLQQSLERQLDSLQQELSGHLWLMPDFAAIAQASLQQALRKAAALAQRFQSVMDGYQQLPRLP